MEETIYPSFYTLFGQRLASIIDRCGDSNLGIIEARCLSVATLSKHTEVVSMMKHRVLHDA